MTAQIIPLHPNAVPVQDGHALALVQGEPINELPKDLYIPPDALEVVLESFEGPLDLLLYLIRKQNLNILDIPVARVTEQYMNYILLLSNDRFELAAEYLVMAAMLAEIKSRMLLPRVEAENEEDDPRAELVRRLLEYERYKGAAEDIESLPRMERDVFNVSPEIPDEASSQAPEPHVSLPELLSALSDVLKRAELFSTHQVEMETLSVRARMTDILSRLADNGFTEFSALFDAKEGRMGVVVTFIAVLELTRESLIDLVQNEPFTPIYVASANAPVDGDRPYYTELELNDSQNAA